MVTLSTDVRRKRKENCDECGIKLGDYAHKCTVRKHDGFSVKVETLHICLSCKRKREEKNG